MTKQELHSIHSLRDEIKFWERALESIRNKSPVGSPQFDAVPCNSGISNRVQDRVENTRSIEEIIVEKKAELETKERMLYTKQGDDIMTPEKQIMMIQPSETEYFDEQGWCVYSVTSHTQDNDFDVVRYFVSAERLTQGVVRRDFQTMFPSCEIICIKSNEYRKEWR